MTGPRFVDCKCGHGKALHENADFAPQCVGPGCGCVQYRVAGGSAVRSVGAHTPPARLTTAPQSSPTRSIVETGLASTNKAICKWAERVRDDLDKLAAMLRDDDGKAAARAEVADLERRLAEAKAKLRPSPKAVAVVVAGTVPCGREGCDRTFVNASARAMHERRTHDGFDPKASRAQS